MTKKVSPIPEGYHSMTPYLITKDAAGALEFYKNVFGATELLRVPDPMGKIAHAELQIGDSKLMIADEFPEMEIRSPHALGGTPVIINLYIDNVDSIVSQALVAGAKLLREVKDQFYGDRSGCFLDPYGHMWNVATHIEDLSPEEIQQRSEALKQQA